MRGKPRPRRYRPSIPVEGTVLRRRPQPLVRIDRGRAWFVLWTSPRCEDEVVRQLREAHLAVYAPVEALSVIRRGKAVTVEQPLLARYVFVGLNAASPEWTAVSAALMGPFGWVCGLPALGKVLASVDGAPVRIPASILQAFADGLGSSLTAVSDFGQFRTGQPVKAAHGPLEGIPGAFLDGDDTRVRALFDLLGRQTLVAFKPGQLEAA